MIADEIDAESVKPGEKFFVLIELMQILISSDKYFLRQVIGILIAALS